MRRVTQTEDPQEGLEGSAALEGLTSRRRALVARFNYAMCLSGLGAALAARLGPWGLELAALLGAHALMWLNLLTLAKGVEGLLAKRSAVAGLIIAQLLIPLAGGWLLVRIFPSAMGSLLLGVSLWVVALLYACAPRIST